MASEARGRAGTTSWRRIAVIARREFTVTVRRREFLLVTFGLPLLYLVLGVIVGAATVATASTIRAQTQARVIGFLDQSGMLNRASLTKEQDGLVGKVFDSLEAGQKAVREKKVRLLVVVPKNFARSGGVTVYAPESQARMFSDRPRPTAFSSPLRRAMLQGKVDDATITRVLRPIGMTRLEFDSKTGAFQKPDMVREIGRFAVPYVFSLLLVLAVMFSSSYLLHGIVEEKENRVIEVLLSAATHEELLAGKLIGLGAVGLVQLGLWVGSGLVTLAFLARSLPVASLGIGPGVVATAVLMFVFGYSLYAALLAGVGSMGTSWRESQQMASVAVMFLIIPLMVLPAILELPDGIISRVLSLFPLTAPIGMMLRVAAGGASAAEVILCAVLLLLATIGTVRLAARLLRLSLLMYGQRPTPGEIWRWLRRAA